MMKNNNDKRKSASGAIYKVLSLLIVVLITASFITDFETDAVTMTKPSFDITITKDKNVASVYDEVVVTGTITPNDFATDIFKKRIVFLLDTSGSMGDSSRLTKAKAATKQFLKELKDIPNVEVAIVTFATAANINPYGKTKNDVKFYKTSVSSEYNRLVDIVDDLVANGGTNTAEGLRKAKYMLDYNDNGNIDKNLVFMTDGLPTYYPLTKSNSSTVYTTPSSSDAPARGGSGISVTQGMNRTYYDNVEASKNAAIAMGNLYKGDANIYTIGYSLDNVTVNLKASSGKPAVYIPKYSEITIEAIHKSMLGNNGKKDRLYYAETNTIEELFADIVKEIKEEYKTEEVEIKMDLTNSINSSGSYEFYDKNNNPIERGIIVYKSETINGQIVYKADPIKFIMRISGEEKGTFDINGSIRIQCIELKYDETIPFNFSVTFSDRVPQIRADLTSAKSVEVIPNGQFIVSYKIYPADFKMDYVAESEKKSQLTFDTYLNFDLGSNIALVNDASNNTITQEGTNAKSNAIKITYTYDRSTQTYKASDTDVSYKMKVLNFEEIINFGDNNFISYVGVYGQKMQNSIETPTISVFQPSEITHGFFDGIIENGIPKIDEDTESKILTSGTNRQLAATLIAYNNTKAQLILSPEVKLAQGSKIKVCTLNSLGKLEEISAQVSLENNIYNISFSNLENDLNYVTIIYEIEVPKEKSTESNLLEYNTTMKYLDKSKDVKIVTKGLEDSPELF